MTTTPIAWFGGKRFLVPTLLRLMPPHHTYVEVFGGSGALLFAKHPSPIEVYNDLDSGLVHFFRVLRNPEQAKQLKLLLELTPYAREEYCDAMQSWKDCADPVEKARQWFVIASMSFAGRFATSWGYSSQGGADKMRQVGAYHSMIQRIEDATTRLRDVAIDHRNYKDVLYAYDTPDTLFYCDPPYIPESRTSSGEYTHEMTRDDHVQLLDILQGIKGMVMLSGYHSELYDARLDAWDCIEMTTVAHSRGATRFIGKGAGVRSINVPRTECIWLNPAACNRQDLFSHAGIVVGG
jgi:DNA adenine methylase